MIDPSMSRDLTRRRKEAGYAAICAVGFAADPGVFRVATAENTEGHLSLLQPGTWQPLHFARLVWTPGLAVARTIVVGAEKFLTDIGASLGQHWFRAELNVLDDLIRAEAESLRSPLWTHLQLIARLRAKADEEADRFAAGII